MAVRIEKILTTVVHEAHKRQTEETVETLAEERERYIGKRVSFLRNPFSKGGGKRLPP
jgi:hypothetical protein